MSAEINIVANRQSNEAYADELDDAVVVDVPRGVLLHHGAANRARRGQRPGGQKQILRVPFVHHGRENVFVVVMNFIASMTPSLMPSPESFTPPNGEHSIRNPGT